MKNAISLLGLAFALAALPPSAAHAAGVFGNIPDIPSLVIGTGPHRSGQWSIRPFGTLGDGYPAPDGGFVPQGPGIVGDSFFGPIPDYVREEGFGFIPQLRDIFAGR